MSETLHTCPDCGTPNFTTRGLKAHVCKGKKAIIVKDLTEMLQQHQDGQDAVMGEQLTTQYHRATGGMKEVVIFGAMMMKLREEHPEMTQKGNPKLQLSKRGQLEGQEPTLSLTKWLETYAPEVKRATAYRFLHVTESIAEKYVEIVGAKVAKAMPLPELVTAAASELPKGFEAKQLELFEFVNGTSQRSWLDMFSPESPQKRGHKTKVSQGNDKVKPKTAAELAQDAEEEIATILDNIDAWFIAGHQNRVKAETLTVVDATLSEAIKKIRGVKA